MAATPQELAAWDTTLNRPEGAVISVLLGYCLLCHDMAVHDFMAVLMHRAHRPSCGEMLLSRTPPIERVRSGR
jgi:hypothetical protein